MQGRQELVQVLDACLIQFDLQGVERQLEYQLQVLHIEIFLRAVHYVDVADFVREVQGVQPVEGEQGLEKELQVRHFSVYCYHCRVAEVLEIGSIFQG